MPRKSKSEREYERERQAGQRVRRGNIMEQGLFAGFLVGVLILGVYLLIGDNQRTAIKQAAGIEEQAPQEQSGVAETSEKSNTPADTNVQVSAQPQAPADKENTEVTEVPSQAEAPETKEKSILGFRLSQVWPLSESSEDEAPAEKPEPIATQDEAPPEPQVAEVQAQSDTPPKQKPEPENRPAAATVQAQESAPARQPEPEQEPETTQTEPVPEPSQKRTPAKLRVEIQRSRFIYRTIEGRPTGEISYIDYKQLNDGYMLFYTEARGTRGGEIFHQWRHNGEVVENQRFTLTGDQQQIISRVYIPPGAYGTWRVYVRDNQGEVLKIGSALYERR